MNSPVFMIAEVLGLATIEPPRPILPLPDNERRAVKAALDTLSVIGSN